MATPPFYRTIPPHIQSSIDEGKKQSPPVDCQTLLKFLPVVVTSGHRNTKSLRGEIRTVTMRYSQTNLEDKEQKNMIEHACSLYCLACLSQHLVARAGGVEEIHHRCDPCCQGCIFEKSARVGTKIEHQCSSSCIGCRSEKNDSLQLHHQCHYACGGCVLERRNKAELSPDIYSRLESVTMQVFIPAQARTDTYSIRDLRPDE